jgi:CheY-like chemotaxis protein
MPERVLILDDEEDFAAFAAAALKPDGHEVKIVTESVKVPTVLEEFDPTVLLLDIVMPEPDGIEVVSWLAKTNFSGRVILMSGYGGKYIEVTSKIAEVKGLRLTETLTKPVSPATLRQAVAGS